MNHPAPRTQLEKQKEKDGNGSNSSLVLTLNRTRGNRTKTLTASWSGRMLHQQDTAAADSCWRNIRIYNSIWFSANADRLSYVLWLTQHRVFFEGRDEYIPEASLTEMTHQYAHRHDIQTLGMHSSSGQNKKLHIQPSQCWTHAWMHHHWIDPSYVLTPMSKKA